jgi:molecular chaperone DnaJ
VRSHAVFGRDGDDLVATLEVPVADAALGFEIEVETLDGPKQVDIKPGAQHGVVHILKGLGANRIRSKGRGDLRLEIKVLTPSRLDGKQKSLFKQIKDLHKDDQPRLGSRRVRGRF